MDAIHYTFDQTGLSLPEGVQATGEYWLAGEGGYLLKYILSVQAPLDTIRKGFKGSFTWEYALSQIDTLQALSLPEDCRPALEEGPVLSDAIDLIRRPDILEYGTSHTIEEAAGFYRQELEADGFSETGDPLQFEDELVLNFQSFNPKTVQYAFVDLAPLSENLQVSTYLFTINMPESPQEAEPTAGVEVADMLPEDVPIYSGAYGLNAMGEVGVVFYLDDSCQEVAEFYRTQLLASGWQLDMDVPGEDSQTLLLSKGGISLAVSCNPSATGNEVGLIIN
jgi:hypothetical protein